MIHAIEQEEASSKAVKISEWIEEIILLDDLLALHAQHGAEGIEANQYREKRQGIMEQLNELLTDHHLKIVVDEKAA